MQPSAVQENSVERIKKMLASKQPLVWLFYGDSITHGASHVQGFKNYAEIFAERVRSELGRCHDAVINTAISGNTIRDLLNEYDQRVERFHPDLVFLMIGMNDCSTTRGISVEEFEGKLQELCARFEKSGALSVLQTTCPILPNTSPDRAPHFDSYMDRVRSVAKNRNLPLVDHTRVWREQAWKHYFLMNNEFHPNHFGHVLFAQTIFRDLGIFDPASPMCRLFVP